MPTHFITQMEKFLFLDLDDTVFQTRRKCSDNKQVSIASYNLAGQPSSYFLPKQKTLLALLDEQWRIIPTTARTQDAYARVDLGLSLYDGAILNHGGTIISADGQVNTQWYDAIQSQLEVAYPLFPQIKKSIQCYAKQHNMDVMIRVIEEAELQYYIEVRHNQAVFSELELVLMQCVKPLLQKMRLFDVYLNSNSLTILPKCINKLHAVDYRIGVLKHDYGEILTMGMGDSLSDAPFIALCDYAMIPQNTQLHQQLITD